MTDLYCNEQLEDESRPRLPGREYKARRTKTVAASKSLRAVRRYWTKEEHARFLTAFKVRRKHRYYLAPIAAYVGTRTVRQVRTHIQKFLLRLEKDNMRLIDLEADEESLSSEGQEVIELNDYIEQNQPAIGYWDQEESWEFSLPPAGWWDTPLSTET
jgi:hypothetical protein